jgi:hypothetical protein
MRWLPITYTINIRLKLTQLPPTIINSVFFFSLHHPCKSLRTLYTSITKSVTSLIIRQHATGSEMYNICSPLHSHTKLLCIPDIVEIVGKNYSPSVTVRFDSTLKVDHGEQL